MTIWAGSQYKTKCCFVRLWALPLLKANLGLTLSPSMSAKIAFGKLKSILYDRDGFKVLISRQYSTIFYSIIAISLYNGA